MFVLMFCAAILSRVTGSLVMDVNRLELASVTLGPDVELRERNVKYWYMQGDTASVRCAAMYREGGSLTISYQFNDERLGGNGVITSSAKDYMDVAVGLHTVLGAPHNGTTIQCQCSSGPHTWNIKLQLLIADEASHDGTLNLRVNSVPLRYQLQPLFVDPENPTVYHVKYYYDRKEMLTWESGSTLKDVVVGTTYNENATVTTTMLRVQPNYNDRQVFEAHNNTSTLRTLHVTYSPYFFCIHEDTLSLNLTHSVLELNAYGELQQMYYRYDEGEKLVLKCSTSTSRQRVWSRGYYLVFDGTVEREKSSITKRFKLTSAQHNTTLVCSLMDENDKPTVRTIKVLLQMKDAPAARPEAVADRASNH